MAAWRAAEASPLQRDAGSASCGAGLGCCGSAAGAATPAPASGTGWLISAPAGSPVTAAGAPSGVAADEGVEGSAAAWGAAASAGAPAAGLVALESLCSGALSLFMIVVTRTAFCRRGEKKLREVLQPENLLREHQLSSDRLISDSILHFYTSLFQDRTTTVELCEEELPGRDNKKAYLPFSSGKVLLYLRTHILLDVLI